MHKNMHYKKIIIDIFAVTFREEGVDWNSRINRDNRGNWVTFREEGVDWNSFQSAAYSACPVTFREEGVDWNIMEHNLESYMIGHLPRGRCGLKSVKSTGVLNV